MSNVLIGIIGIILFIGLALAGALILGSDFLESSAASRGAVYTSQAQQISNAVAMYEMKTGRAVSTTTDLNFLVPRFLKTVPAGYRISKDVPGLGGNGAVLIEIPNDDTTKSICEQVQRQSGQLAADQEYDPTTQSVSTSYLANPTGCIPRTGRIAIFSRI